MNEKMSIKRLKSINCEFVEMPNEKNVMTKYAIQPFGGVYFKSVNAWLFIPGTEGIFDKEDLTAAIFDNVIKS